MEEQHIESKEDPRAYVGVFSRLGSPPPGPGRIEKLVAELRRRAVVLGQRLRSESGALGARVRAAASVARQREREKRAVLLQRGREAGAALARRVREERSLLAGRAREARTDLARRVVEKRVVVVEHVRQVSGALVRRAREERVVVMRGLGEMGAALLRRAREERTALVRRTREERAALRQTLREQRTVLSARVQEKKAAFAHRLNEWASRPRWQFEWHHSGPRALPRQPSMFVGLASFAFAFGVAWYTGGPTDEVPERKATVVDAESAPAPVSVVVPSNPEPVVLDVGQVLRTRGVSEATQLAVVDELTKDPSDVATNALLAGIDAESLHVSMACLRALAGRSCDAVAAALADRLDDPTWQRRAWAARVLGANDCTGAGGHLSHRLAVEPDERVQAQLKMAINTLKEPGA